MPVEISNSEDSTRMDLINDYKIPAINVGGLSTRPLIIDSLRTHQHYDQHECRT